MHNKPERDVLILRILFIIFSSLFGYTTYNIDKKVDKTAATLQHTINAGGISLPPAQHEIRNKK